MNLLITTVCIHVHLIGSELSKCSNKQLEKRIATSEASLQVGRYSDFYYSCE